jgi:hypothetical protein
MKSCKLLQAVGLVGLAAAAAFGQASSADVASMKFFPPVGVKWIGATDFSQTNYGYHLDNSASYSYSDGNFADWSKWRFVRYTGLTGMQVTAWGDWGRPIPPPPFIKPNGDRAVPCEHTHVAYGVWLFYSFYSSGNHITGWVGPVGGGGKSGKQVNDWTCTHPVINPLSSDGNNTFGWGQEAFVFNFAKTGNPYLYMVVGAMALSHGALGCPTVGCINQPWIFAYAFPW